MDGAAYNAHTAPILIKNQILPYDLLIKQAQLNFMHSIYHKYAPPSFTDVWQRNADRNPALNLRNADDFYLLQPRTEAFKKSTLYNLPLTWNELSPFIKLQNNKTTFKWALRAHLMDEIDDN